MKPNYVFFPSDFTGLTLENTAMKTKLKILEKTQDAKWIFQMTRLMCSHCSHGAGALLALAEHSTLGVLVCSGRLELRLLLKKIL